MMPPPSGDGGSAAADAAVTPQDAALAADGAVPSDAAAEDAGAIPAGPVAGTTSIFDGVSLKGWVQSNKMWWSVKDGTIDGKSTSGGQIIITADDYSDFRIVFLSRMPFNAKGGHLGVCFWGGRAPAGSYNGCKLYIPPNPWSWDYGTGGGLKAATYATMGTMDAMAWHRTELLCRLATGTCLAAVDGKLVMTYKESNPKSIKSGPIGLQIHSGNSEVQYKDVYVDPAPKGDTLLTVP